MAFFIYSAVADCILPVAQSVKYRVGLVNLVLILVYACLVRRDSLKSTPVLSVIRDWLLLGLVLLVYREGDGLVAVSSGHGKRASPAGKPMVKATAAVIAIRKFTSGFARAQ